MLEMILLMSGLGTVAVALTIGALEWRALVSYWRAMK